MASEICYFQEYLPMAFFTLQKFIGKDECASRFGQITNCIKHCRPDSTNMLPNFVWKFGLAIWVNQRKDDIVDAMIIDKNEVKLSLNALRKSKMAAAAKANKKK